MSASTESMFMEALAAARAGNRVRARSLLTKLLKTDSSVVDYWVWMSSVVESQREKIYCLESAKLRPLLPALRLADKFAFRDSRGGSWPTL
jgi:hypothetical protein